jgi:hypothetical protein
MSATDPPARACTKTCLSAHMYNTQHTMFCINSISSTDANADAQRTHKYTHAHTHMRIHAYT